MIVSNSLKDLPLSAGKTTFDVADCNSFKALRSSLDRLSLEGLEFRSVRLTLARIVSASSFFQVPLLHLP